MKTRFLMVILCASVLAQYDDDLGSPLPQRVTIPGAVPVPAGRPPFRPRIQGSQGRILQGPDGSGVAPALRIRRPGAPGGGGGGRIQQQGYSSILSTGEPQIPKNTASTLGPAPPLPAILAQARPLPSVSTIPPRPIQEDPNEDETDIDLDSEKQPLPGPISTPLPATLPTRPQILQPAVFRPIKPGFRPERPLVTNASPIDEVVPVTSRQQFRQPSEDLPVSTRQQFQQSAEDIIPARQQLRQQSRLVSAEPQYTKAPPQQYNARQQQITRPPPSSSNPQQQFSKPQRAKKPVAQIIRRYREDNADGSITWGYENDDGSFKEETIGVDCVVRGKYGYTDPDGLRREYTYSSGIPCDKEEEERKKESNEGFIDYQNNKYVLPNGDAIDLETVTKNKARKPVAQYRN